MSKNAPFDEARDNRNDAEACVPGKPQGIPPGGEGRQLSPAGFGAASSSSSRTQAPASRRIAGARPQGGAPAKPACPAGGPVASTLPDWERAPPVAPSSLDTCETTRPTRERSVEAGEEFHGRPDAERLAWVLQVCNQTLRHRRKLAKQLRETAQARFLDVLHQGRGIDAATEESQWHRSRARGQLSREERVLDCGTEMMRCICKACARMHEFPMGCRLSLLCRRCRNALGWKKVGTLKRARRVVLADAQERGLLNSHRRGGGWTEKMITLTAPHVRKHSVSERIHLVLEAWRRFLKRLNRYLRERDAHRSAHWYRAFEWTLGSDRKGHPHLHIWFFGPFLDVDLVREWWRLSLGEAGYPPSAVAVVIVDIRMIRHGEAGAHEVIKYMAKDVDANGNLVPPPSCTPRCTSRSKGVVSLNAHGDS